MNKIIPAVFQAQPIPASVADSYFEQAEALQALQVRSARRWSRTGWVVAGVAITFAAVEAFAIGALSPIHTVEWRLIRVDKSTGYVGVVRDLTGAPAEFGSAVTRYFIGQYVQARESYISQQAAFDFRTVSLMSAPAVQRAYAAEVNASNKQAPQVVLGRDGYIKADINAISILEPGLAQARVTLQTGRDQDGQPNLKRIIITLSYRIHPDAAASDADRSINPLGFIVTSYRVSQETP